MDKVIDCEERLSLWRSIAYQLYDAIMALRDNEDGAAEALADLQDELSLYFERNERNEDEP